MEKIWYPIRGYEKLYKFCLSDETGIEVFAIERVVIDSNGISFLRKERKMTVYKNKDGYFCFGARKNGKSMVFKAHRAIAYQFLPEIQGKTHVNHINGIKTDNRVENLEWCTQVENTIHAWDSGLIPGVVKINSDTLDEIRSKYTNNREKTYQEIATEYGLHRKTVSSILNRNSFKRYM